MLATRHARSLSLLSLSSSFFLSYATAQTAFDTQSAASGAQANEGGLQEIIVTARRREESLQDVPQTVNAVTADAVEKLNILRFDDVQSVVPGLTLTSGSNGYTTSATLRGASFQVESGARPTVEFYLNDAPIESIFLFQTMYDVGQIEVLRGPQGTLRGRAAPSGSITVTTHRADLDNFGGYADVTTTDQHRQDIQGALNLPLIRDKVALRLAGLVDENEYDDVKSIHNPENPFEHSHSGRATLSFEPTDGLSGELTYQYLSHKQGTYAQVESFSLADPAQPAANPVLTPSDRLGLTFAQTAVDQKMQMATGHLDYRLAGQKLSYVGAYSKEDLNALLLTDTAGVVANSTYATPLNTRLNQRAHELRIASEERLFGWMDYTAGVFRSERSVPNTETLQTLVGLPGATGGLNVITDVHTPLATFGDQVETSVFGNLTAHVGDHMEFSGGLRHIDWEDQGSVVVGGTTLASTNKRDKPLVYNLSASYHLTDDLMVYASFGKSWREGPNTIGIFRPLTPRLTQFTQLKDETSRSYEIGLKSTFLDRKLRVNATLYRQDFTNYLYRGPLVYYVNLTQAGAVPATFNFVANVDATVTGAELEIAYQPIERWTIGASLSYDSAQINNGSVACNDFNGDGIPDVTAAVSPTVAQIQAAAGGEAVAACKTNARLSTAPNFTGTLQSEYSVPLRASLSGFVRGLFSFYGQNPQDPYNPYDDVTSYGLLNLYLGVHSDSGAWEVSLFGKNIGNKAQVLNVGNSPVGTTYVNPITGTGALLGNTYVTTSITRRREFGLNVRYAFGSR